MNDKKIYNQYQKKIEEGLILCTGFYKNGFLLAPACSNWVANELNKYFL